MPKNKKGQVAAPKGDTTKQHGAVTQTGTETAQTTSSEETGKTNTANPQPKSFKPHFQPKPGAYTWEQQVERALSVLNADPEVLGKMKATWECSMTEVDDLQRYMMHKGIRPKRDAKLFASGVEDWLHIEFVKLLVKVALNEEPLHGVTPPKPTYIKVM